MWETMWNRHLREQKRPPWGQDASTVLESVLNCVWEDRSKMSVLDVGCGSGADSIQLHKSGFVVFLVLVKLLALYVIVRCIRSTRTENYTRLDEQEDFIA